MGTKVMVRATRSFNGRVDGEWYYVDPDDPHIRALISGGYFAYQEPLIEVPTPVVAPEPVAGDPSLPPRKGRQRGKVAAEPRGDHPDGAS